MPCTKLQQFFSWLSDDISKTCWCYRWRKHGRSGEQHGQAAPYLLFLRAPFPIHMPLRCIVSQGNTKPALKRRRSSAPQHSLAGLTAQHQQHLRRTECLVAPFCHVDVGDCISGPEVCFQHYWSCNLVLWPGTCLSTVFLSLTMSKVAKESYCHELGEKSCFMATPVH